MAAGVTGDHSIAYLELFTISLAMLTWAEKLANSKMICHCDNMSVVSIITSCMHDQYQPSVQWPVDSKYVVAFIAYFCNHRRTPGTNASYVSALRSVHKINILRDPT